MRRRKRDENIIDDLLNVFTEPTYGHFMCRSREWSEKKSFRSDRNYTFQLLFPDLNFSQTCWSSSMPTTNGRKRTLKPFSSLAKHIFFALFSRSWHLTKSSSNSVSKFVFFFGSQNKMNCASEWDFVEQDQRETLVALVLNFLGECFARTQQLIIRNARLTFVLTPNREIASSWEKNSRQKCISGFRHYNVSLELAPRDCKITVRLVLSDVALCTLKQLEQWRRSCSPSMRPFLVLESHERHESFQPPLDASFSTISFSSSMSILFVCVECCVYIFSSFRAWGSSSMVPGSNLLSVRLSRSHHTSRFRSFMFISSAL